MQLGATRLSGLGNDAIFMGVMKPIDVSRDAVQVWTTTTGTIVCADPRYLDWFGRPHQELAGMEFRSLGESPELLTKLVAQAATASMEVVQAGSIRAVTNLFHTYLGAQEVEIVARMGGQCVWMVGKLHERCMSWFLRTPSQRYDHKKGDRQP